MREILVHVNPKAVQAVTLLTLTAKRGGHKWLQIFFPDHQQGYGTRQPPRVEEKPGLWGAGPVGCAAASIQLHCSLSLSLSLLLTLSDWCRYKDSFQIKTEYFERKVNVCFNPVAMSVADKNKENVPSRPPQAHSKPVHPSASTTMERRGSADSLDASSWKLTESGAEARAECEAHVRTMCADHASELRTRDSQTDILKARLDAALQDAARARQTGSELLVAQQRNSELSREVSDLRKALDDRSDDAAGRVREAEYLEGLRQLVDEGLPDLAALEGAVFEKSRVEREERDKKLLKILKSKDSRITELEGEKAGLLISCEQHRTQVGILENALEAANREMEKLILEREQQARSAEERLAAERLRASSMQATLEDAEKRLLERQIAKQQLGEAAKVQERLEAEVDEMLRDRTAREGRVAELERMLSAREGEGEELKRQLNEQGVQLDALLAELTCYTSGVASSDQSAWAALLQGRSVDAHQQQQQPERQQSDAAAAAAAAAAEGAALLLHGNALEQGGGAGHAAALEEALSLALRREQALERSMRDKEIVEQKLRSQLAKLERIEASAQGTAMAQEEKLQMAVEAIGESQEVLGQTRESLSKQVGEWRHKAEQLEGRGAEYEAVILDLEKDLESCKRTLRLYHDRIVSLVGPEDDLALAVQQFENKVPLSVHLRETGRLGQQHAYEKQELEKTIVVQARALEELRNEHMHSEARAHALEHEANMRLSSHDETIRDLQHQIRCKREDGAIRLSELEQQVKVLSGKSDLHKQCAMLSSELTGLKVAHQMALNEAQHLSDKVGRVMAENRMLVERGVQMQGRLRGAHGAGDTTGRSDLVVSIMSDQIEQQQGEIDRLEGLLLVAKEEHDRRMAEAREREEASQASMLVAEAQGRRSDVAEAEKRSLERVVKELEEAAKGHEAALRRAEEARAAADKAASVARDELLLAEEASILAKASVAEQVHAVTGNMGKLVAASRESGLERKRERDAAVLRCQQLEERLREAVERCGELERDKAALKEANKSAAEEIREANARVRAATDAAQRENERLQHNLSGASVQMSVLSETVQALRGDEDGSVEQIAADMAARAAAALSERGRMEEANTELHAALDDREWQVGQLEASLVEVRQKVLWLEEKLEAARLRGESAANEVNALKGTVSEREAGLERARAEAERGRRREEELEKEVSVLRKGLEEERARHRAEAEDEAKAAARDVDHLRQRYAQGGLVATTTTTSTAEDGEEGSEGGGWKAAVDSVAKQVIASLSSRVSGDGEDDGGDASASITISEVMAECALEVDKQCRMRAALEYELDRSRCKARLLSASLDASVAAQRLTGLRVAQDSTVRGGASSGEWEGWCKVLEGRVALLLSQVEETNARGVNLEAENQRLRNERDALSAEVSAHGKSLSSKAGKDERRREDDLADAIEAARDDLERHARKEIGRLVATSEAPAAQSLAVELAAQINAAAAASLRFSSLVKTRDSLRLFQAPHSSLVLIRFLSPRCSWPNDLSHSLFLNVFIC